MSDNRPTQSASVPVEVEMGKTYYWCACGKSDSQPFCDGKHKGGDSAPVGFVAEKTGTLFLCGCKRTKTPPYCDGSHKSL